MTLGRPVMLILVPVAAAFVVWSLRGRGYGRGKLLFLGLLRTLLVLCAALAVSKVSILLPTPKRHVVFLIDASASCADRLRAARALVKERIERLGPQDTPTVLLFDRRVYRASDESPAEGRRLPGGTDISAALDAALAAAPTGRPAAVFLLTDGIETQGDSSQAVLRLAARGIPVYIPRPSTQPAADVRVASLDAPSMVDRGQSFRLTCRIEATGPLAGELKLTRDGELILTRPVEVAPAEPVVVSIVENPDEEGLHVYSAALIARGDRFPQNNALKTPVFVRARLLVAYLAGYEGETPVERLLKRLDGFRFRRLTGAKELTAELLAETSVVVVDDFPAALLGTKDRELASFVREDGGGLMMLGGSGSFGVGGYIETAVDTVLPVHCDPRDARKKPLALVVVLDSSGSMGEGGGRKMDMARAAAVRTLSRLAEADRACVIAFRVAPEVVVPLRSVEDVDGVARKLARIAPVGGTNIYPALRRALKELENSDAPLRHVVILSDGKSQPGDAEAVIALYRSAKVTLSGVATGEDAERPLLARLAAETGGRFYDATDIRRLPELFLDDLRRVDGPLVRKGSLKVEPAEPGDILKDIDLTELPAVEAYNRTRSREGADVLLRHTFEKREEPVLAVRRVGLGRAASLMLSFESGWAGELPRWRPWGNLFVKLLQHVRRSEFPDDYSLRVRRHGRAFEVLVVANSPGVASKARKLAVRLRGRSAPAEVPLVRTGVRTWEGKLETDLEGVVSAVLVEGGGDAASPLVNCYVPQGYPREYAELAPRVDTLERIARVTGGRLVDNLEEFRAAGGRHLREKRDLTPWLVGLVLVLFLTELVGRAAGYL